MVKICYNIVRSDKVEYTITKKKIKNFILRIYPDLTIAVSAPLSATSKDIENFVLSKKDWIEKTLEKLNKLKDDSIKILGKKVEKKVIQSDLERISLTDRNIFIYTKNSEEIEVEKKFLEWKYNKLKEIIEEAIEKYRSWAENRHSGAGYVQTEKASYDGMDYDEWLKQREAELEAEETRKKAESESVTDEEDLPDF